MFPLKCKERFASKDCIIFVAGGSYAYAKTFLFSWKSNSLSRRSTRCETAEAQRNAEMVYAIVFSRHEIPALISRKKEILGVL